MMYKRMFVVGLLIFLMSVSAFSQDEAEFSLEDLQTVADNFSKSLAQALPFNSTMGLNWADAYIGQILGKPPRFGIGISIGTTLIPVIGMDDLFSIFGVNLSLDKLKIGIPLPGYTVEARIGGIVLPFDLGIKFGYVPTMKIPFGLDIGVKNIIIGADIRYSLLPRTIKIVKLSIGFGYNYLNGGITKALELGRSFDFGNEDTGIYNLNIKDPTLSIDWKTHCFELKAQASFSFKIVTPYAGVGVSYAKSQAGYRIATDVSVTKDGSPVDIDKAQEIINDLPGLQTININEKGFESIQGINNWNFRAFGGLSFNIKKARIDLTLMYNFLSKSLGGTLGVRFQM